MGALIVIAFLAVILFVCFGLGWLIAKTIWGNNGSSAIFGFFIGLGFLFTIVGLVYAGCSNMKF